MESIVLNQETGLLTIGSYTIHPRVSYAEFTANYPKLKSKLVQLSETYIYLPRLEFLNYEVEIRITSYTQYYIDNISVHKAASGKVVSHETWIENLHKMVVWMRHMKSWLLHEFGKPHNVKSPVLLDEDKWLSKDEVTHLDFWNYSFEWGKLSFGFDWETSAMLFFSFDSKYQIQSWDGLLKKCQHFMQESQYPQLDKSRNYPFVKATIEILSAEYDYMTVRAGLTPDLRCLVFDLPQWSTRAVIDIQPDYPDEPYRISRHDTTKKAYASKETLVEVIRKFLETEAL